MKPSELYTEILKNLSSGSFSESQATEIEKDLAELKIMVDKINSYSMRLATGICYFLTNAYKANVFPPDVMAHSCFYTTLTKKGVDTTEMKKVIDHSPELYREMIKYLIT